MARVGRVDLGVKAATVQKSGGGGIGVGRGPLVVEQGWEKRWWARTTVVHVSVF